jgi:release factor glutamine methyltransferase
MVGLRGGGPGYVRGVRMFVIPGVFRPISDSRLLAAVVAGETRARGAGTAVLDVCTGSGIVAACAARAGASRVVAVDVSRRALLCAAVNGRGRVRPRRGDLLDAVAGERFDVIASNPPYVPDEVDELPTRGARRAWDAGRDGRVLLDRICRDAARHLRPGGTLLLVQSSVIGEEETLGLLGAQGLDATVLERRRGPLGPLLSARAPMLEAKGMLAPGQRTEDIVVVGGRLG